jgi:transcriptional regulator GlxA family with amidase domain
MLIAIPLYHGFAATDAIGPYEVLARLPGARVVFVSTTPGPVVADTQFLTVVTEPLAAAAKPDVIVVPGAPSRHLPLHDQALLEWLVAADATSQWTTSVCTGSYILAAAGLLRGKRAVSHWLDVDSLAKFGAVPVRDRYVFDGKIVTAAGMSAGYDMSLALAARIAGDEVAQAIQLGLEYDPQPPFDSGSPDKAPAAVVARVRARAARHSIAT